MTATFDCKLEKKTHVNFIKTEFPFATVSTLVSSFHNAFTNCNTISRRFDNFVLTKGEKRSFSATDVLHFDVPNYISSNLVLFADDFDLNIWLTALKKFRYKYNLITINNKLHSILRNNPAEFVLVKATVEKQYTQYVWSRCILSSCKNSSLASAFCISAWELEYTQQKRYKKNEPVINTTEQLLLHEHFPKLRNVITLDQNNSKPVAFECVYDNVFELLLSLFPKMFVQDSLKEMLNSEKFFQQFVTFTQESLAEKTNFDSSLQKRIQENTKICPICYSNMFENNIAIVLNCCQSVLCSNCFCQIRKDNFLTCPMCRFKIVTEFFVLPEQVCKNIESKASLCKRDFNYALKYILHIIFNRDIPTLISLNPKQLHPSRKDDARVFVYHNNTLHCNFFKRHKINVFQLGKNTESNLKLIFKYRNCSSNALILSTYNLWNVFLGVYKNVKIIALDCSDRVYFCSKFLDVCVCESSEFFFVESKKRN